MRTRTLLQKLFGFEGTLAAKNAKRNRRVFRATVIFFTVGMVLFVALSALNRQVNHSKLCCILAAVKPHYLSKRAGAALGANLLMNYYNHYTVFAGGGLRRMLNLESILCAAKALRFGIFIAIVLTYCSNLPIKPAFPISYQIPRAALLLCICAAFPVTLATTRYVAYRLRGQNTIEAVRPESER